MRLVSNVGFGLLRMPRTHETFFSGPMVGVFVSGIMLNMTYTFLVSGGPGCSSLEGFLQENGPICELGSNNGLMFSYAEAY